MPTLAQEPPTARPAGRRTAPRAVDRVLEALLAALPEDLARFARLCAEIEDWDALLERAGRHGVAGVLHHALGAVGYPLPHGIGEAFERQRAFGRLGQTRLQGTLARALEEFGAAGIAVAALKGPVLGERLYPDAWARPCTDLDFLVAPEELDAAARALAAIGYEAETGPSAQYYREHSHHVRLYQAGAPLIELHHRLYAGFGIVIPAAPFLARSQRYRAACGRDVRVLAPEDEFVHLALHAAGHGFVRLAWGYELKLLLARHPEIDGSVIARRARSLGGAPALAAACQFLHEQLNAKLPPRRDVPALSPARRRALRPLIAVIAAHPRYSRTALLATLALELLLCDGPACAVSVLRHEAEWFVRRRLSRRRDA